LALLDQRAAARAAKDYAAADRLRDDLAARGLLVKDGKEGQTWQRMKDKG
jgi:cysteinyl-tRNA synthetase